MDGWQAVQVRTLKQLSARAGRMFVRLAPVVLGCCIDILNSGTEATGKPVPAKRLRTLRRIRYVGSTPLI